MDSSSKNIVYVKNSKSTSFLFVFFGTQDWIEKVVIVIWVHEKVPFERYTVDLSGVIKLGATLLNEKQIQLCELEQTFRVFLLKINSSVTFLAPISPECKRMALDFGLCDGCFFSKDGVTFSVAAEVKDPTEPSRQQEINKSKKWIPWLLNLNNSTKSELIPKSKKTRLSSFPPSESLLIDLCVEENCQREVVFPSFFCLRSVFLI